MVKVPDSDGLSLDSKFEIKRLPSLYLLSSFYDIVVPSPKKMAKRKSDCSNAVEKKAKYESGFIETISQRATKHGEPLLWEVQNWLGDARVMDLVMEYCGNDRRDEEHLSDLIYYTGLWNIEMLKYIWWICKPRTSATVFVDVASQTGFGRWIDGYKIRGVLALSEATVAQGRCDRALLRFFDRSRYGVSAEVLTELYQYLYSRNGSAFFFHANPWIIYHIVSTRSQSFIRQFLKDCWDGTSETRVVAREFYEWALGNERYCVAEFQEELTECFVSSWPRGGVPTMVRKRSCIDSTGFSSNDLLVLAAHESRWDCLQKLLQRESVTLHGAIVGTGLYHYNTRFRGRIALRNSVLATILYTDNLFMWQNFKRYYNIKKNAPELDLIFDCKKDDNNIKKNTPELDLMFDCKKDDDNIKGMVIYGKLAIMDSFRILEDMVTSWKLTEKDLYDFTKLLKSILHKSQNDKAFCAPKWLGYFGIHLSQMDNQGSN